ncbi:Hg(II)-responsive transcriptional regulator [Acidihalobacter prosperus]|uniref:Mercuric resistance operon regulatory protein n=1 Tax=Acidihalobacter prosperus TaxID=160660 RepID=A0A1A6C295_9GAMM|nr:Hg(II)-responsive transcriptional regulator [Acidihalobacter prosperus]OBS08678.1 Hg(II)-responsive transcriptional regulator [Acidihalobacter prosperus]
MAHRPVSLTIGGFAQAAGVGVETIRFYQRKGLLPEPPRPPGGTRRYGEADVARLKFIKSAQRLGFNLDEIGHLLRLDDGTHCEEAAALARERLHDVRERLQDLMRMEAALAGLVERCAGQSEAGACPLIAALQGGAQA